MNNPLRGGMVNLKGNIAVDMDFMGLNNNPEGIAVMGLTYAASLVPGSTIGKSYNSIDEIVITSKFIRGYRPVGSELVPPVVERGPSSANGSIPTGVPARGSEDDFGDYGIQNITHCKDMEDVNLFNSIVRGYKDWLGMFLNLLAASQTQDITSSQFKSFFASKRTAGIEGELLAKHFPKLTGGMPDVLGDNQLRGLVPDDKWTEYRTTFSSGGLLLTKMIMECPDKYLKVFSPQTIALIKAYNGAKHSEAAYRDIPEKALGVMYCYLLVTDQMVDNLYGPKRSFEAFSVQEKASLKAWFTEAKDDMQVYKPGLLGTNKVDMPAGVWNI
jgi:hypothetical protein